MPRVEREIGSHARSPCACRLRCARRGAPLSPNGRHPSRRRRRRPRRSVSASCQRGRRPSAGGRLRVARGRAPLGSAGGLMIGAAGPFDHAPCKLPYPFPASLCARRARSRSRWHARRPREPRHRALAARHGARRRRARRVHGRPAARAERRRWSKRGDAAAAARHLPLRLHGARAGRGGRAASSCCRSANAISVSFVSLAA